MRFLVQSFRPSSASEVKGGSPFVSLHLIEYLFGGEETNVGSRKLSYHCLLCILSPFFRSPLSLFAQSSANRCVIRAGTQLDRSLCFLTKGIPKGGRCYRKGWSSVAKGEVGAGTHCRRRTTQFSTIFVWGCFVWAPSGSINVSSSGACPSISLDSIFLDKLRNFLLSV